jgi:GntR family transcriptional regulator
MTTGTPAEPGLEPEPVDRASALPLWAQIHADLQRRLQAGAFSAAFPGELALVDEYGVSRHTVRQALRQMREDGQVVAERGRPPRLAEPAQINQPLGALYSLFASVEAAGLVQRSIVRALELRTDVVVAARLDLPAGTELFYLERLRLAGDEPLAVDQVWLPAALARPMLDADFRHTALYDELEARCGVRLSGGQETIHAVIPSPADRELLQIDVGTAAFAIDRRANVRDRPTEWRHTLVRGDRFSVSARFSERGGYQVDMASTVPPARTVRTAGRPTHRKAAHR